MWYTVHVCGKEFSMNFSLQRHIRTHTGDNLINVMYVAIFYFFLCSVNKEFLDHIIMYLFNLMFKVYNNVCRFWKFCKNHQVNNCILLVKKRTYCMLLLFFILFISVFLVFIHCKNFEVIHCIMNMLLICCPSVMCTLSVCSGQILFSCDNF
jgi:hypothetical protein